MYFPNGSAEEWWTGLTQGAGSAWNISSILEPLLPSRQYLLVLNNIGNYSTTKGFAPSAHGTNCAGAWHCYDPRKGTASAVGGGISVDQVIANALTALDAADAGAHDVVRSVIYVASADRAMLAAVWRQLTESPLGPAFSTASTLLGVAALGFPGQLVELDLTAALTRS